MKLVIKHFKKQEAFQVPLSKAVSIGRVKKHNDIENQIVDDDQSVSRVHAQIFFNETKLYIKDLSSNGTYINNCLIEKGKPFEIKIRDSIKLAQSQSLITIQKQSEEESEQQRQRSRNKIKKVEISESTKKMLKGIEKYKTKQQKIKFLKLMGHKNAEEEWDLIQAEIRKSKSNFKQANEDIERQFQQSRTTKQKRGLGK